MPATNRTLPRLLLLLLCAGYFLLVSIAAVSPPRLRAPLDVLFLLGTGTVLAGAFDWWSKRRRVTPYDPPSSAGGARRAESAVPSTSGAAG